MSTLLRTTFVILALIGTVSSASATFVNTPATDKIFTDIDRKAP